MDIFDEYEIKEDQAIIHFLKSIIARHDINSICDYGCGDGRILRNLNDIFSPGITYTGIDFWSNEFCKSTKPDDEENICFVDNGNQEIEEFINKNQYDLIYSSFALHHFRFPIKELKRLESLVAPNGYLVLIDMHRDYTDVTKIADNVRFFNSQMMMALRGSYHRVPYTKEETCDLLLALNMEITDQRILELELSKKELAAYKKAFPEMVKKIAVKASEDDESQNIHPKLRDIFNSTRQYMNSLTSKLGTAPDNLIVTTLKKI